MSLRLTNEKHYRFLIVAPFSVPLFRALTLANVSNQKNTEANDIPEQLRIRREKRARLLESGADPYPVSVDRTISLADLRAKYAVVQQDADQDLSLIHI